MDRVSLVVALLFMGTTPAMAASDARLVAPAQPEPAAYVRFISERNDSRAQPVLANGKVYDFLGFNEVSPYFVMHNGPLKAEIAKVKESFNVESGRFYTIVLNESGALSIKEDPKNEDRGKAQILLYNFSGLDDLSLKTADGNIEVIPPVANGEVAQMQMNPVRVDLAVFQGDRKIRDIGSALLERAQSYSAFLASENDLNWVKATTERRK